MRCGVVWCGVAWRGAREVLAARCKKGHGRCLLHGARRVTYLGARPVLEAAPGCSPSRHPPQGCTGCCGTRGPAYAALATAPTDSTATHASHHTQYISQNQVRVTRLRHAISRAHAHTHLIQPQQNTLLLARCVVAVQYRGHLVLLWWMKGGGCRHSTNKCVARNTASSHCPHHHPDKRPHMSTPRTHGTIAWHRKYSTALLVVRGRG